MSEIKKPMLAVDAEDLSKLKFPVLASPKLDGIRCLKVNGQALSRKFKPIPNNFIRSWIESRLPDGIDGELLVGTTFQSVQSGVMRVDGEPDFVYAVFDLVTDTSEPFTKRYAALADYIGRQNFPDFMKRVHLVPHVRCNTHEDLAAFEEWCVKQGYEGTMVRSVDGPYKNGRSTLREGYLLKIKRWVDTEGTVVGFEEQMTNTNEATVDELGHTKRSSHQAGMIPAGTLGKILVEHPDWPGEKLPVGTGQGWTKEFRQEVWNNQAAYLGKILTFKYIPHGVKELPRHPIGKGFRHSDDLGE